MAGGAGTFRDDNGNLVISEAIAEHLADRMATRFHSLAQNLKGGALGGNPGPGQVNPVTQNQWGGKGIIKFNPTNNEIVQGIKQQISLFTWQSPDGLPHPITVEVGRLAAGVGGPGADGSPGDIAYVDPTTYVGRGSVGGGSWPAALDASNNPLYYRAVAQVVVGSPGTMQDIFFIDINRGQRFTTTASYVAVTAQMLGPPVDEITGSTIVPSFVGLLNTNPYISGSLAVYATLGAAIAPSLAPVLYTQYIDFQTGTIPQDTSFIRIIPARANVLLPMLTAQNENMQISLFSTDGRFVAATTNNTGAALGTSPFASTTGIPLEASMYLPEDAFGVAVTSGGATGNGYRLIYQLSV